MELPAGPTTGSMHRTMAIVLLIVLFVGLVIHYGCWIM